MYIVFITILAIMFVLVPIIDATGFLDGKADPNDDASKVKCKEYYATIAYLWVLVTPVFIMCIIGGISLADIGFRPISFNHDVWITAIIITLAVVLFIYEFVIPLVRIKKIREKIINDAKEDIDEYPRTSKEKWLYSLEALSSGICEETVYRGFLLFLLYAIFPGIPIYLIGLIAFVAFGIGHLYQGWRNAVVIGLFGVLSIYLLIVTDSLIPSILLHFFGEFADTFTISQKHGN